MKADNHRALFHKFQQCLQSIIFFYLSSWLNSTLMVFRTIHVISSLRLFHFPSRNRMVFLDNIFPETSTIKDFGTGSRYLGHA